MEPGPESDLRETGYITLDGANAGRNWRVCAISGGRAVQRLLAGMGIRIGKTVRLLCGGKGHPGPVLIAVGESRMALGRGMAQKILVEPEQEDRDA